MLRFAVAFFAALAALFVLSSPARGQEVGVAAVGGNGGLVNLPGGGGVAITPGPFVVGQHLNTAQFVPVSYTVGSGQPIVVGLYQDYIVLAHIDAFGKPIYFASIVGPQTGGLSSIRQAIVSRWYCTCHPGVEHKVVTDCSNGSVSPEKHQENHDRKLAAALHAHPAKTEK